jgi:hypothetical protein
MGMGEAEKMGEEDGRELGFGHSRFHRIIKLQGLIGLSPVGWHGSLTRAPDWPAPRKRGIGWVPVGPINHG